MTFRIKKLETGDEIADVSVLAKEIWTEHYTPLIGQAQTEYMIAVFQSAERIKKDIAENNYSYFAVYANGADDFPGRQTAYLALRPDEKGVFVSKIYVKKECRRLGIAAMMMEFAEKFAKKSVRESGALFNSSKYKRPCLWLTVNKGNLGSIEFYKKSGFEIEREAVTDIGQGFYMDDYVMISYFDVD